MGELILCKTQMAANSYFLEEASLNIYSLEELSYYIFNNAYLLKSDFVDESLCDWIKEELGLSGLANELLGFIESEAGFNLLIGHLLRYSGYLTKNEIKATLDIISSFEGKSEAEIVKIRADHMINDGRYLDAAFSYESILDRKVPMDERLKGDVYHNLGCALCGLFFFERARDYFEQAYRLNREEQSVEMLLLACLFARDEEAFAMYVDRYQILPEDALRIRGSYEARINSTENREFAQQLQARLDTTRNEIERQYVFRDIIDGFKSEYKSTGGVRIS